MKRFFVFLVAALTIAAVAGIRWQPEPLEERVVRIRAAEEFPDLARALADEPVEVLAELVDYADDKVLLLKAQAAVLRHPRLAREILPVYGQEPEFREILRAHGDEVLLPIDYFLRNEVRTVALAHTIARIFSRTGDAADLTPRERGWAAIHFVRDEGHDFLGQFALDAQGEVQWIQTERVLEGLNSLFAGGVRTLETKKRTGAEIEAGDLGWAALDGLAFVGATALLRAGKAASTATKAATTARSASVSARAAAWSTHAAKATRIGLLQSVRYAKWPAILATGYVVVRHPAFVGDVLSGLADAIGWPRWVVLGIGWTLLLLPVFLAAWMARRVLGLLTRPARAARIARPGARRFEIRPHHPAPPGDPVIGSRIIRA